MLYVNALDEVEITTLEQMHRKHPVYRVRMRAHAILLSDKGHSVQEIAGIYDACRQAVSGWIKGWETRGITGLLEGKRPGSPRKLNSRQEMEVVEAVKQEPRSLKKVLARLSEKFGIPLNKETMKRICKRAGLSWRRVRRSLKGKRDQAEFDAAKKKLEELAARCAKGEIDVFFGDGAGFDLVPSVPYAWQEKGSQIEIPSAKSRRLNTFGFINRECEFESFVFESTVTTAVVVACIDEFILRLNKPTYLFIDNAPVHKSAEFLSNLERWREKGLFVEFLPAYSPELNIIEILWRKIKYEWLPFSAYSSYEALKTELFHILGDVGGDFRVQFT